MLSAFFSLSETAIFSLSNLKLRRLQEKYSQGSTVKNLLSRPTHTLSAINFGNTLVNIGITSLSTALFVNTFGDKGLFLAIFISSILILFLGEIFPKTFAIYLAEKLSLFCAPVLSIFSVFFFPFVFVIEKIVMFFSSLFTWLPIKTSTSYEELKTALILSRKEGHISAEEEEMVSNVLEFKDTWVSEIMNPRIDIHGIDIRLNQQEVLKILREKKHSKFPVYEGSLDNITAMLYAKDIFLNPSTD
jgi:CBS domain containing-hemolysin-like protein